MLKLEFDGARAICTSWLQSEAGVGTLREVLSVNKEQSLQDKQFQSGFSLWLARFKKLTWVFLGV